MAVNRTFGRAELRERLGEVADAAPFALQGTDAQKQPLDGTVVGRIPDAGEDVVKRRLSMRERRLLGPVGKGLQNPKLEHGRLVGCWFFVVPAGRDERRGAHD